MRIFGYIAILARTGWITSFRNATQVGLVAKKKNVCVCNLLNHVTEKSKGVEVMSDSAGKGLGESIRAPSCTPPSVSAAEPHGLQRVHLTHHLKWVSPQPLRWSLCGETHSFLNHRSSSMFKKGLCGKQETPVADLWVLFFLILPTSICFIFHCLQNVRSTCYRGGHLPRSRDTSVFILNAGDGVRGTPAQAQQLLTEGRS